LSCVEIEEGRGWLFLLFVVEKKCMSKIETGEGREDGQSPGYKLNIIDEFTDKIISLVILSVKSVMSPYDLLF